MAAIVVFAVSKVIPGNPAEATPSRRPAMPAAAARRWRADDVDGMSRHCASAMT
jgi:hypothetical protein